MSVYLHVVPDPACVVEDPDGFSVTVRHGRRSLRALVDEFGPVVWEGGNGAPELNRAGADPRRPWM